MRLLLSFEGQGTSFLRWESKQHARFVVLVDENVIGTSQPEREIGNGKLAVTLEPRPDETGAAKAAAAMATSLHTAALSRLVVVEKRTPL